MRAKEAPRLCQISERPKGEFLRVKSYRECVCDKCKKSVGSTIHLLTICLKQQVHRLMFFYCNQKNHKYMIEN